MCHSWSWKAKKSAFHSDAPTPRERGIGIILNECSYAPFSHQTHAEKREGFCIPFSGNDTRFLKEILHEQLEQIEPPSLTQFLIQKSRVTEREICVARTFTLVVAVVVLPTFNPSHHGDESLAEQKEQVSDV